ncbi:MAG: site-specific DNA-methyltransferase [Magnetococcales bacterium]|nr:site-specific DNA-methyltransferase [Magnetococcales bacterium]
MNSIPAMAKAIEVWPVERLIPYAANARTHSESQVAKVAASMKEFGFTSPILVDGKDGIIAGHCRLMAARKLGLTDVPVIVLDHLSDAQRRAYILADNKLALDAEWDNDLLAAELDRLREDGFELEVIGFSDEELGDLLDGLGDGEGGTGSAGDEETIPEPPPNPVSRPGDLWVLGDHRLLCGDSTKTEDVQRLMKGERAILFATDPPYLVDYDGTNHPPNKTYKERQEKAKLAAAGKIKKGWLDGNKDWSNTYGVTWDDSSQGPELYERFIQAAIDHAIDTHAAWYCWHASKRQAMLESVWEKMGAFVHQQIIWNKPSPVLTRTHYLWKHEPCFYGWIRGNRPEKIEDAEPAYTVWDIKGLTGDDRPEHPTPKPLDCFAIPMRQHVEPGGLCYEPFSGSGSQIMAGEQTGRRVYAMEISPVYVDVAVKRFLQATGKIVYLEGSGGKTFEQIAAERGIAMEQAA